MIHVRRTGLSRLSIVLLALILLSGAMVFAVQSTGAQTSTLVAVADASVSASQPNENFGSRTTLEVDASTEKRAYLTFDIRGISGAVSRAVVRLDVTDASSTGGSIAPTGAGWSESTITFNTRPAPTAAALSSVGEATVGEWVEFDVTPAVTGNGLVSFVISSDNANGVDYASRETGNPPQLVIESATTPTATATSTPPPPTATATSTPSPTATSTPGAGLTFPIRAAFYYPWFPEAWSQSGLSPFTHYHPTLGYYDTAAAATTRAHIAAMQYGHIQAGIASWWGQGHHTDADLGQMLKASDGTGFKWAIYHEQEGQKDLTTADIRSDLTYIRDQRANDPDYLRIDGRFVVFVYNADDLDCEVADRWAPVAREMGAYLVLKVFPGYRDCANQPDSWHQYAPANAVDRQAGYSYNISPGFWHALESQPRLGRDLGRWQQNVRDMVASGDAWQLVTSFNEWGEGTIVESATEWQTSSGYGAYLDALHAVPPAGGTPPTPTPSPTATPPAPTPTNTPDSTPTATPPSTATSTPGGMVSFAPVADAHVRAAEPDRNFGTSSLRTDGSPIINSYLKFDVQGLSGTPSKATLRIYASSANSVGFAVAGVANTSWQEGTITWSNAPAIGATVRQTGAIAAGTWVEVDVTSLIKGNGLVTLAMTSSSPTATAFVSRESSVVPPVLVVQTGSGGPAPTPIATPSPTPTLPPSSGDPVVVVAAGDIACDPASSSWNNNDGANSSCRYKYTAQVAKSLNPDDVLVLGDNQYEDGNLANYLKSYDPTWGQMKAITHPIPGNHEYIISGAAGYYDYFGAAAGDRTKGYYSFDLGNGWIALAVNSTCSAAGGCGVRSPQYSYFKGVMEANAGKHFLVYAHHPYWSTGKYNNCCDASLRDLMTLFYANGAEISLAGHDHSYQRFAPQTPDDKIDPNGIRHFVVGTGGRNLQDADANKATNNWEFTSETNHGVLKLSLYPDRYEWAFVTETGTVIDSGSYAVK